MMEITGEIPEGEGQMMGEPAPFDKTIEGIVKDKLKNGDIKKEDLNGLELGVNDLKKHEGLFEHVEPFKAADSVIVDELDEKESVFLNSNLAFVGDVVINSVQLTTSVANLNDLAEESRFYDPKVTPIIYNSSFEPVRYVLMKIDEKPDAQKAKDNFAKAIDDPEQFYDDERYLIIKGSFQTINAPYSRDTTYKVII